MLGAVGALGAELGLRGPELVAVEVGMEWVTNSTCTSRARSAPRPSFFRIRTSACRTPSMNGVTKPGWSKYWRTLSIVSSSAKPVSSSAAARSSRYCRHEEYEEYTEVTSASSRW